MKVVGIIGACAVMAVLAVLGGHHIQRRRVKTR